MMDKATICETIARTMGLKNVTRARPEYGVGERVTYEVNDLRRCIFNPFSSEEDFAKVILFYMERHKYAPWIAIPPSREAFLEFAAKGSTFSAMEIGG